MKIYTIFFFLFVASACTLQKKVPCDSILKSEIDLNNLDKFGTYLEQLQNCGLDSEDYKLLSTTQMSEIILSNLIYANKKITYQDFYNGFQKEKAKPGFNKMKKDMLHLAEYSKILNTAVSIQNWKETRTYFLNNKTASEAELNELDKRVKNNTNPKLTYSELIGTWGMEKMKQEGIWPVEIIDPHKGIPFNDSTHTIKMGKDLLACNDYEIGISLAKKENKLTLIYFSSTKQAESWMMEKKVFEDADISNYLKENYIVIDLIIDEKKEMPIAKQYKSKVSGIPMITIGHKNADIEAEIFHSNAVPLLAVLDRNGNLVGNVMDNKTDPKVILNFLMDVKKK